MKRLLIIGCLLHASAALAQDARGVQVFGGTSALTFNCGAIGCFGTNPGALMGWNAEVTGFFNHMVGATADIGGYYRSFNVAPPPFVYSDPVSQYTFLFGPTVQIHPHHRRPYIFAHALFGVNRSTDTPAPLSNQRTDTAWAMAAGGGFGVNITKILGFRVDYDWMRVNNYSQGRNEFRFSGGIVLNLPPIGKS